MKTFGIDYIRQALEQTLYEEHLLQPTKYLGGKNQVNLFSFYEQLEKEEEIDRYVEVFRELTEQQNRLGIIMNGTIIAPENPSITNLYSAYISPMSFTCSFRVKLADRDMALETINNLFDVLKGRKCDIAELDNGKLFKVGTIGEGTLGLPMAVDGDFLGEIFDNQPLYDEMLRIGNDLDDKGVSFDTTRNHYYYVEKNGKIEVVYVDVENDTFTLIYDQEEYPDVIFPPEHNSFTKYKLSLSFDSVRCDEPRNLNGNEYCTISFGGSATLVSNGVALGNDLVKVMFTKKKVKGSTNYDINDTTYVLEPLELPSGNNPETQMSQLMSNNFVNNSHSDSISLTLQYSFVLDRTNELLNQFYKYGRYGKQGTQGNDYTDGITPNLIFEVIEFWSSWGNVENETFMAKVNDSVDIENTESDTLTIKIPLQIQGEND